MRQVSYTDAFFSIGQMVLGMIMLLISLAGVVAAIVCAMPVMSIVMNALFAAGGYGFFRIAYKEYKEDRK